MKKLLFIIILLLIIAGCKESFDTDFVPKGSVSEKRAERGIALEGDVASAGYDAEYASGSGEMLADAIRIEEKIVRTAYVTIRSPEVKEAYDRALLLAKKYDGIIVNSSTSKWEEREEALIEIKIPPKHFMTVLDEIKAIGDIESKSISEEDVTEEYYDIQARLRNKRKVRERLFDLLRKAYRVKEVLEVEREIERVGEEIERLEGRLRYLDSKTDYARIHITLYNRTIPIIETIGIKEGFIRAFQIAIKFFFGIIWFIIILIPLFIIIAIIWIIIALFIRRKRHRRKAQ